MNAEFVASVDHALNGEDHDRRFGDRGSCCITEIRALLVATNLKPSTSFLSVVTTLTVDCKQLGV